MHIMPVSLYLLKVANCITVDLCQQHCCQFDVQVATHITVVQTLLQIRLQVFLLHTERIFLKLSKLFRIILLQVIHQLRHAAYIVLFCLLAVQEGFHQLAEIVQLQQLTQLDCHTIDIRLQQLCHQFVFACKIHVERLFRHT